MTFIQQILSDVDGQGSSKRVMAFGILALISCIALGVTFFHATFQEQVWQDLIFTLLAGFGLITSEKFTKRSPAGSGANPTNDNNANTPSK